MSEYKQSLHSLRCTDCNQYYPDKCTCNSKTKVRGKLGDEYEIYLSFTDDKPPKSLNEWLDS